MTNKAFEAGRQYAAYEATLEELLNDWASNLFDTATITTTPEAWVVLRQIESDIAFVRGSYIMRTLLARTMIDEALANKRLVLLNGVLND